MNTDLLVGIPSALVGLLLLVLAVIYFLAPVIVVMQLARIQRLLKAQVTATEDLRTDLRRARGEVDGVSSAVRYQPAR